MTKSPAFRTELPYAATRFERFVILRRYWLMLASFAVAFLLTLIEGISSSRSAAAWERHHSPLQAAHAIGLAMYSYASDHDNKYPTGKSSTEVFQQLMDGGYITDSSLLYFPMSGKTKAEAGAKILKPENVCWDVTDNATFNDTEALPLIFLTGYKIRYVDGGKARPLANALFTDGIAVFFTTYSAEFMRAGPDGIPLIASTYDFKGKAYRQLTPDGPLP